MIPSFGLFDPDRISVEQYLISFRFAFGLGGGTPIIFHLLADIRKLHPPLGVYRPDPNKVQSKAGPDRTRPVSNFLGCQCAHKLISENAGNGVWLCPIH